MFKCGKGMIADPQGMRKVTGDEMHALDQRAISEYGIPSLLLMENAGRGVADLVEEIASRGGFKTRPSMLVFSGKGNNGGDGLVAARHLWNRGYRVQICLFCDSDKLKRDPAVNFGIVSKMGIPAAVIRPGGVSAAGGADFGKADILIDALFGVGLHAPLKGIFYEAVHAMNDSGGKIVAVDVPSGLNSDTGQVMGTAVKADLTATLAVPKKGLYLGEGPKYSGEIRVVDIGWPRQLLESSRRRGLVQKPRTSQR